VESIHLPERRLIGHIDNLVIAGWCHDRVGVGHEAVGDQLTGKEPAATYVSNEKKSNKCPEDTAKK
jgi:hypothetical protein